MLSELFPCNFSLVNLIVKLRLYIMGMVLALNWVKRRGSTQPRTLKIPKRMVKCTRHRRGYINLERTKAPRLFCPIFYRHNTHVGQPQLWLPRGRVLARLVVNQLADLRDQRHPIGVLTTVADVERVIKIGRIAALIMLHQRL